MMRRDLQAARAKWTKEAKTKKERAKREKSDFLKYCDSKGRYADFHSHRHTFTDAQLTDGDDTGSWFDPDDPQAGDGGNRLGLVDV